MQTLKAQTLSGVGRALRHASRFARDLIAQELGIGVLTKLGMRVLTATGDDLTNTDDPGGGLIRRA
jgi:hypothetical protein